MEINVKIEKKEKKEIQEFIQYILKNEAPSLRIISFKWYTLLLLFIIYLVVCLIYLLLHIVCANNKFLYTIHLSWLICSAFFFVFSICLIFFFENIYVKVQTNLVIRSYMNNQVKYIFYDNKIVKISKNKKGEITETTGEKLDVVLLQNGFVMRFKPVYKDKPTEYYAEYKYVPFLYKNISKEEKAFLEK